MKVTKYEHSCVVLEEQGSRLVIDPGTFSKSFTDFSNIAGVVVTHVHPDHFDLSCVLKILQANPEAFVYSVGAVSQELAGHPHKTLKSGDREQCGPFHLAFFGGQHATIHESYPALDNIGVLVNNSFYYGGDSFQLPGVPVQVLAVPLSAPWMKVSEAMDYLVAVSPQVAFPMHNAVLSDIGNGIHNRILTSVAEQNDIAYKVLEPGDSFDTPDAG